MRNGFVMVCVSSPKLYMGNAKQNAEQIIAMMEVAEQHKAKIIVFPELALTGAGCGSLFGQSTLLDAAGDAIYDIVEKTEKKDIIVVFGTPVDVEGRLYNCAVVVAHGKVLGVVPQSTVSDTRFSPAPEDNGIAIIGGMEAPFGANLIFECLLLGELRFCITVGNELTTTLSIAERHAANGANLILSLCSQPIMAGAQARLRNEMQILSGRLGCCIVRADAGKNETVGQGGHISYNLIMENGVLLTESRDEEDGVLACDVDVQLLEGERRKNGEHIRNRYTKVYFNLEPCVTPILRTVNPGPFVLDWHENRDEWCADIIEMQADYLVRRIDAAGCSGFVVPLDGGIDTTIAAMACARAVKKLGWEAGNVIGVITLCEGITRATTNRAIGLARNLNFSQCHYDINEQLNSRLEFLGVDKAKESELVVNVRERIRLGLAVDIADQISGMLVLGYNMTSIAIDEVQIPVKDACLINAGIPKTVMRFLLIYIMTQQEDHRQLIMVLQAVLAETAGGASPNQSAAREAAEQIIFTPLQMNDFFLYHVIKHGFSPLKLMRLAEKAFGKQLDQFRVYDCLKNFIEKFFSFNLVNLNENDTPKFIEPSLINFTIPKEADFKLWIDELESLKPEGYEKADLTPLKLPETTAKTEQESDKERVARVAQLKQMEERARKEIEREREEEKRRGSKIQSISNNAPVVNTSVIERELPKTPEEFAQQMERLQKLAMEQIEREREEERKEKDSN